MIFSVGSKDEIQLVTDLLTECLAIGGQEINIIEGDML